MKLIRQEGETKIHVRGKRRGHGICGVVLNAPQQVKPLDATVSDICRDCLIRHLRRKLVTR